jgi:hypothetical protein
MRRCLHILIQIASLFIFASVRAGELDRPGTEKMPGAWLSDQPGFRPDLTYPIFYTLALQGATIGFIESLDHDDSSYTGPSWENFRDGFIKGPHWDHDAWYWNAVAHPLAGSEIYLRARAQGCSPGGSLLFVAVASTVWEFGIEGWYERPSNEDLIVTPLAGALIGEARFRAKRSLLETDTRWSRTLAVAIDPLQSLAEVVGDTFGQDWREPAFRKSPATASRSCPIFNTGLATDANGNFSFSVQCSVAF